MSFLPRHERMREVAYEERRVLTVDGKAVLQIRACRGCSSRTVRSVCWHMPGRRCLLSQAETGRCLSGTEYDHEKTRGGLNRPAWEAGEAAGFPAFSTFEIK